MDAIYQNNFLSPDLQKSFAEWPKLDSAQIADASNAWHRLANGGGLGDDNEDDNDDDDDDDDDDEEEEEEGNMGYGDDAADASLLDTDWNH